MIIDTKNIEKLLATDITTYEIAKRANLSDMTIKKYRDDYSLIVNMKLSTALTLQDLYIEHLATAKEIKSQPPLQGIRFTGIRKSVNEFNNHTGNGNIFLDPAALTLTFFADDTAGNSIPLLKKTGNEQALMNEVQRLAENALNGNDDTQAASNEEATK